MPIIFKELDDKDYEKFASGHPQANFLQSSYSGNRRRIDGWNMHLVGMVDDDRIVSSALLSSRKTFFGFYDFECQQGPFVNYDDANLTSLFLNNILSYVKNKNGLGIKINPKLAMNHRDMNGSIVNDGYDGHKYIDLITKSGFLNIDIDNDPRSLRWYFKKDMSGIHSDKDLFDSVSIKTRQDMQRSEKMGVEVSPIEIEDIDIFIKLMDETGARRNFEVRSKSYYTSLLEYFGKSRSMCLIARLNVSKYITYLNSRIDFENHEMNLAIDKVDSGPKLKLQIDAHKNQITELREKIKEMSEKKSDKPIIMAGAVFINYGSELVYLSSGAYVEYGKFCPTYAIQLYAMRYAIKHKLPIYNFYGTKSSISGHPEMDGIYNFKKGFNGYLEEQIGYFYKNIRPVASFVVAVLRKVRKIIG